MTKVKICGIKTVNDALAAMDAGADMLGFNFYPKSLRYIDPGRCRNIMAVMRKYGHLTYVGVFVNASVAEIRATVETCALSLIQLHGDERPETVRAFQGMAFKAFRGKPKNLPEYERARPPAFLIDASVPGEYGGTGIQADWSAAADLARQYPILLAGGLTVENVAEAVRQVNPWGVDVASGVESSPGVKDPTRMQAFVKAVHAVRDSGSRVAEYS